MIFFAVSIIFLCFAFPEQSFVTPRNEKLRFFGKKVYLCKKYP